MNELAGRFAPSLALVGLLVVGPAFGRNFGPNTPDPAIISSDDAAAKEVARIQGLKPSRSAVLNQQALEDVKVSIDAYSGIPDQISALSRIDVGSIRVKATEAFDQLVAAIPNCKQSIINDQLIILRRQWSLFGDAGFEFAPQMDDNRYLSEDEQNSVSEASQFFRLNPEAICTQYKDTTSASALRVQIIAALGAETKDTQNQLSDLRQRAPRAQQIVDAYSKYKDDLTKALESDAGPATKVAGQLGWIIVTFCAFAILMFMAVRFFRQTIQLELIKSGQLIQFATVMVLLIVICLLGMSDILHENTLGTLLGGIGGYVLSQGVGRAARRDAASEDEDGRDQASSSSTSLSSAPTKTSDDQANK